MLKCYFDHHVKFGTLFEFKDTQDGRILYWHYFKLYVWLLQGLVTAKVVIMLKPANNFFFKAAEHESSSFAWKV